MRATEITIRPMATDDHAFIRSLSSRLTDVAILPGRNVASIRQFQHDLIEKALVEVAHGDGVLLLACDKDGNKLGFIYLESAPDPLTKDLAGYVSMLALSGEAEGHGVASQLMIAAEDWARGQGFTCLSLDVFASNDRARTFYQRQGFQPDSVKLYKLLE